MWRTGRKGERVNPNYNMRKTRWQIFKKLHLLSSKILFKKWFLEKFTRKYSTTNIPTMMEIF